MPALFACCCHYADAFAIISPFLPLRHAAAAAAIDVTLMLLLPLFRYCHYAYFRFLLSPLAARLLPIF